MKHLIKKILTASLASGFISWFALISVFPVPFAFAATSCTDLDTPSYVITNGGPDFLLGDTIKTKLTLKAKSAVVGNADYVDVYMVLDTSNSMSGAQMTELKKASTAVVNAIQTADGGAKKSRVGLISFTGTVYVKKTLTTDYNSVKTAISGLTAGPANTGTSIYGGLKAAGDKFRAYALPANTQRFIVLETDGDDTWSPPPTLSTAMASVPSDVTVHTVGFFGPSDPLSFETDPKKIAAGSGSKTGKFTRTDISGLVSTFQSIIDGVIAGGSLRNVSLTFTRNDTTFTSLTSVTPAPTSVSSPDIIWVKNLGSISGGGSKDVYINYAGTAMGSSIPLNLPSVSVSYDSSAGTCTGIPLALTVQTVNIGLSSSCIDDPALWTPDPAEFCSTETFTQTSNCGNTRTVSGTLTCTQCNDGIDNDGDGAIDFGGDRGCTSFLDNNEKDYFFHIITF